MAEHKIITSGKQDDLDRKRRTKQSKSGSAVQNSPLKETPFAPPADEHSAALSRIPSPAQRQEFIMELNNTYGQRYVQRLLASMQAQAKLRISDPGDASEQEADRVAEAVTSSIDNPVQREAADEEEELQAQLAKKQGGTVSGSLETRIKSAGSGGQPLPENVKQPMEQAFGAEFNGVRVHHDAEADVLNQQLGARAFTTGRDIFFLADEYRPGTDSGKKLIAHELTHVIQQAGGKIDKSEDVNPPSSILQRQSVPGVVGYGNFSDLGNGLFGTTQPTDATEVSGLVNEIRTKGALAGLHQNIKVITGTHGDASGHLVGEEMFYTEDLAHEGHKVAEGGWINVLDVKGKSKATIENWMVPGTSAIILAWCYSKTSQQNWANVHCYKNNADYQAGKAVW
jgi:hypothetical protein